MTAKFFIVADSRGEIFYRTAAEIVTRNVDAFMARQDAPYTTLAQADDADQAERFVALLRNQRAA